MTNALNQDNPDGSRPDVQNFYRAVMRVRQLVLEPGYQQPDPTFEEDRSRRIECEVKRKDRPLRSVR